MGLSYRVSVLFCIVSCTQAATYTDCDYERSRVARHVIKQARPRRGLVKAGATCGYRLRLTALVRSSCFLKWSRCNIFCPTSAS